MPFPRDPGADWIEATPDDEEPQPAHRSAWVSEAGTVVVINRAGDTVSLGDLPVGTLIPGRINLLEETSTATVILVR